MSKRGQRRGKAKASRRSRTSVEPQDEGRQAGDVAQIRSLDRTIDPDHSLFHYTTAAGLIGILESRTLWATHASFLNDTAECQLLSSLLAPQIREEYEEIVPKLTARGAFKPELLETLGGDAIATEAERLVNWLSTVVERGSPIHVTSFCLHKNGSPESDHGLLSQWRGYGRGGFAIEFDEAKLDDLTLVEARDHSYLSLITRRVSYDDHRDAAGLDKFAGMANAAMKVLLENSAPRLAKRADILEIIGSRDLAHYAEAFAKAVPFLKSPRFKEENEYRIVAMPLRPVSLIEGVGGKRPLKQMSFREGQGGSVVPYIRLFENSGTPLPIRKIIVGPHRDQQNQKRATELLLEKCEVNVPVFASDTTLRF